MIEREVEFYKESLGVDAPSAENIAKFMRFAGRVPGIINPNPWAKHGKVRVYFELYSQNRLPPVTGFYKSFYDAIDNEVYIDVRLYKHHIRTPLKSIFSTFGKSCFSGVKTRKEIEKIKEAFYGGCCEQ